MLNTSAIFHSPFHVYPFGHTFTPLPQSCGLHAYKNAIINLGK